MELLQGIALTILSVTIIAIIWGKIDRSAVAIFGAILMVITGVLSDIEAFNAVDWNVIVLIISMWILAGYFSKSGIPELLAHKAVGWSKGSLSNFIIILGTMAGIVSLFVDNILVILIFAPVALHITRLIKINPVPFLVFIGLCANFTGSALLIGDLPPQMLHSVTGIEFLSFIWFQGRPSSFIILMVTFAAVLLFFKVYFDKKFRGKMEILTAFEALEPTPRNLQIDKGFAAATVAFFTATIIALSLREIIGLRLGAIALIGASSMVLFMETAGRRYKKPSFEDILISLDWRAVLFYISLFILIGGINSQGLIESAAKAISPLLTSNDYVGVTALYWITVPIVGVLEHDAYILAFLYIIKDLAAQGAIMPWPFYWAILWAGTLGSNLTVAGAPALLAALNMCERDKCKVGFKEFIGYSIPFVLVSVSVCYLLLMVFWVFI